MKDLKNFLKSVPTAIWVILLILFLLICCLPAILVMPGRISFAETGQIGDTIGGIMGPFIAIVAAILTFVAFWVQFDANRELVRENRRTHFENRFYKMLDIHLDTVAEMNHRAGDNVDSIFHTWCNKILKLNTALQMKDDFNGFVTEISKRSDDEKYQKEFLELLQNMQDDDALFQKIVFEITYAYFLTGKTSTLRYDDKSKSFFVRQFGSLYSTYLNVYSGLVINYNAIQELLGRYYRHLFQIVDFVDKQPDSLYEEKHWKQNFIGMLRAQMSDYEQLLLYYTSNSTYFTKWDDSQYIIKYQMIRDIPHSAISICAGTPPIEKYSSAIAEAEQNGESFFA